MKERHIVEVRIGVQHSVRELSIETSLGREAVLEALREVTSSAKDELFVLADEHGKSVAVPVDRISYLEFSGDSGRKVGFGA